MSNKSENNKLEKNYDDLLIGLNTEIQLHMIGLIKEKRHVDLKQGGGLEAWLIVYEVGTTEKFDPKFDHPIGKAHIQHHKNGQYCTTYFDKDKHRVEYFKK